MKCTWLRRVHAPKDILSGWVKCPSVHLYGGYGAAVPTWAKKGPNGLSVVSWGKLRHPHTTPPESATVNEPRSRPKRWHQSGTLTLLGSRRTASRICLQEEVLNNSKVEGSHFMHISIHGGQRASHTRWLVSRSPQPPLFTANVQIVKGLSVREWLFFSWRWFAHIRQLLTGMYSWAPRPHTGIWDLWAQPARFPESVSPSRARETAVKHQRPLTLKLKQKTAPNISPFAEAECTPYIRNGAHEARIPTSFITICFHLHRPQNHFSSDKNKHEHTLQNWRCCGSTKKVKTNI